MDLLVRYFQISGVERNDVTKIIDFLSAGSLHEAVQSG
jgi:hypothetical protein